jgi:hypothetical protein
LDKLGNARRAVWVDWIWLPSGSLTERGNLARFWLVQTLVYCRKWPVVSLSTMAAFSGVASGGIGGEVASDRDSKITLLSLVQSLAKEIRSSLAGPTGHSFSLPPSLFSFVASFRCLAMGQLQLALVRSLPLRKPWDQQQLPCLKRFPSPNGACWRALGSCRFRETISALVAARAVLMLASVERWEAVAVARLARVAAVYSRQRMLSSMAALAPW